MHLLYNISFLIAGYIWGDWRHWEKYHSTILFFWFGDLLYNILCYNYIMWEYKESLFFQYLLPNHTVISLLIMFCAYPTVILVFLGRLPKRSVYIMLWMLFWVFIFSFVEYINFQYLDLVEYHHGWTIWWSMLFNIMMFPMLYLHFKKPLLALILSIPIISFFVIYFNVPIW